MYYPTSAILIEFLILSIVETNDSYGYEISQTIKVVADIKESTLYPILKKLEKSGLAGYFQKEHVIVSGDYPYHKPDHRLFEEAAQRLSVSVDECVFVGDIFTNDVYGAMKAGMKAVWIWNGNRRCSLDIPLIHDIAELPQALKNLISET